MNKNEQLKILNFFNSSTLYWTSFNYTIKNGNRGYIEIHAQNSIFNIDVKYYNNPSETAWQSKCDYEIWILQVAIIKEYIGRDRMLTAQYGMDGFQSKNITEIIDQILIHISKDISYSPYLRTSKLKRILKN